MSDGAISQDEIDALLSGMKVDSLGGGGSSSGGLSIDTAALAGFANGLKDRLSADLSTLTGSSFTCGTAVAEKLDRDQLLSKLPETVVAVLNDFTSGLSGDHLYIVAPEFAKRLSALVNQQESVELDEMAFSIASEALAKNTGNEIIDLEKTGALSEIATGPAQAVNVPKVMVRIPQNEFVLLTYPLTNEGQVYNVWEVLGSEAATGIVNALKGNAAATSSQQMNSGFGSNGILSAADMGSLLGGNVPMDNAMGGMAGMGAPVQSGMNIPNVQSLTFPNLSGSPSGVQQGNIGLIMDVFMEMTVELGRTKKQIKDILGMGEGTIIELEKLAGEPVDILVNHKPIAKGEVVVIEENFGVRVTEILSPMERVSTLN